MLQAELLRDQQQQGKGEGKGAVLHPDSQHS